MYKRIKQVVKTAGYNFRMWKGNVRVLTVFLLAFILCFLLSDKIVDFAAENGTSIQMVEAFIWSFGDSNSVLLSSLLLLLLYSDMPFVTSATPFFLVREKRRVWVFGQIVYITASTSLYLCFILLSTCVLCSKYSFPKNTWSRTAAVLAYSAEGKTLSMPVEIKTLEMSRPFQCMLQIFLLMLLYALLMVFFMMFLSLWKGYTVGFAGVIAFNIYGVVMNPEQLQKILKLPEEAYYQARVYLGWISPLNQATFSMHNFGYDKLPTLRQTYCIFSGLLLVLVWLTIRCMRTYSFQFRGTER